LSVVFGSGRDVKERERGLNL